ncbi:MAG: cytochrome C oxidase subunit IV family protein [Candidatus Promineifilaceae bacterium]|nr:cytochrome C oxidase subunit IV family protein [Candidatus Promineifilaceae bacterium]
MNDLKKKAFRLGWIIFIALLVLTAIEFFVGVFMNSIALLLAISLVKAALIVYYFMHIYRLWRQESH